MAVVDDVAVLKRAFFELLAEDDYFLPELAGPADPAAGQLLNSMAAAVGLVDAGLVEVWLDPDRLIEGHQVAWRKRQGGCVTRFDGVSRRAHARESCG